MYGILCSVNFRIFFLLIRGTSYTGLSGEALPKRGTFLRISLCKRVGISLVKVYEWVWKPAISICEMAQKAQRLTGKFYGHEKVKKTF